MTKSAEQGDIWEWRAFGTPSNELVDSIRSHPIRLNIDSTKEEDLYFVSPANDQNVKLRRSGNRWLLKLKLLLETRDGVELYRETPAMMYEFPVESSIARRVTNLLDATVPQAYWQAPSLDRDQFVRLLAQSSPTIDLTPILKTRSQFKFGDSWVELAEAIFPALTVRSVSIQSAALSDVEKIRDELIGTRVEQLEVMNYVRACRKWAHPR